MQEYEQLPNQSVRVYANRLKGKRRRAGWNLTMHFRQKSDLGSPPAKTSLTHSTNSSTVRRPWCSNRMTNSPGDSNSNGKKGSRRKAAIRNVIFDHPSPNLRKPLRPFPRIQSIPAPVIQNRSSPIRPVEAAVPTIYSAEPFKAILRKPKGKPAMHSLRQRRPLNLICHL